MRQVTNPARYAYEGTETTETTITRVGGATDPTLGRLQSRKIVFTTANAQWQGGRSRPSPMRSGDPTTGANVTAVTVCGTVNCGCTAEQRRHMVEWSTSATAVQSLGMIVT